MNKKVLYNINFTAFSTLLVTQLSNLGTDDKLKGAKKITTQLVWFVDKIKINSKFCGLIKIAWE